MIIQICLELNNTISNFLKFRNPSDDYAKNWTKKTLPKA